MCLEAAGDPQRLCWIIYVFLNIKLENEGTKYKLSILYVFDF